MRSPVNFNHFTPSRLSQMKMDRPHTDGLILAATAAR